jgi:hypothetical protein
MANFGYLLLGWTGWLTQFLVAFAGMAAILDLVFRRSHRWPLAWKGRRMMEAPVWLLRLWRADRDSASVQQRKVLLSACGFTIDPRSYLAFRRTAVFGLFSLAMILGVMEWQGQMDLPGGWTAAVLSAALAVFGLFDSAILRALRQYRTERIRGELIAVSRQLLYYSGSRLHLHGKLMRCLPLTRAIRSEMTYLLNEWYHDPDEALSRFQQKLGTEEAYGFAEILRSMRLHESEEVYDLIRDMVEEYKARMNLARESRKETSSYVLFVLAGIPILYTFQVFLYPWVLEASRLFEALNP